MPEESQETKVYELKSGAKVRGNTRKIHSKSVDEFLGIPYAEPPIGPLRFKRPEPAKPWAGVFEATKRSYAPWQAFFRAYGGDHKGEEIWNPKEEMNEDCLQLNIWTRGTDEKRPVMVWIYGGGFATGSATLDIYDGAQLAANGDVVVVSMNYRVGTLGFLCLDKEEAPGNQGLLDQIEALKWVRENIALFGGDPDNVTLFGESAGSVAVACHLLSPYSKELFHKAIMESGCALNAWGLVSQEEMVRRSIQISVDVMQVPGDKSDKVKLVEGLRAVAPKEFADKDFIVSGLGQWPWVPMVDGDVIPDTPENLLKSGQFKHCPIIMGTNKNEGSYFLFYSQPELFDPTVPQKEWTRETYEKAIRHNMTHFPGYTEPMSEAGHSQLIQEYADDVIKDLTTESDLWRFRAEQAAGDFIITIDCHTWADSLAKAGVELYFYHFARPASVEAWPAWAGVVHADEINFIFGVPIREPNEGYSEGDQEISKELIDTWAQFARNGKPHSNWKPYTAESKQYLYIGEKIKMVDFEKSTKHYKFWTTDLLKLQKGD